MRTFLTLILGFLLGACGGGGSAERTAQLEIRLTDAPGDFTEVVVTIDGISVQTTGSNGFVDLDLNMEVGLGDAVVDVDDVHGTITVNLVELSNGRNILLATGALPGGTIQQIRLHLVEATVDGTKTPWVVEDAPGARREALKVPSGFRTGIKIVPRNVDVPNGNLTSITLDFDAARSVVELGNRGNPRRGFDFLLKPVIFVLESDSLLAPATTIASGLNFPRGIAYVENDASDESDDRIVVANAGTATSAANSNDSSVLQFDPNDYATGTPVDATATDGTIEREATEEPAVGAANNESIGGDGAVDATAGEDLLHLDSADFNNPGADTVSGDGLVAVAPSTKLDGTGQAWFLAREDALLFLDPDNAAGAADLGVTGLSRVTGIAFLADASEATFGTLYVADGGANRLHKIVLEIDGGALVVSGGTATAGAGDLDFLSEPIGIALNVAGNGLYVPQRGNGFIHRLDLDLGPGSILDTGLGADSINGITVVGGPALEGFDEEDEVLLLTSTNGTDAPDGDDPLDAGNESASTVEAVVP